MKEYFDNLFKNIDNNIILDEEQINAIIDNSKNVIVIAGAGAGKTTVISAKIKYMVDKLKINPKDILIISFTNKAINELKDRINVQFNIPVDISTFHSYAYKIVKSIDKSYSIGESKNILKKLIENNDETSNMMKLLKKDKIYKKNISKYNSEREYFVNFTVDNLSLYKMGMSSDIKASKYCKYYDYLSNLLLSYNIETSKTKILDFEDIINKAFEYLKETNHLYKYIIVDEFQDVSFNRYNLLKYLSIYNDSHIFVVGDDWQSIYSFAGSDNSLFLNYKSDMNASIHKITNTYRNSNQLINIAGSFVMKNSNQIVKQLKSSKNIDNPVRIYYYKKSINFVFDRVIKEIINDFGINKSILVLGRYKKDLDKITSDLFIIRNGSIKYKKNKELNIDFLTIHSSKGLGYDNVVIINGEDGLFGFPNTKKEPLVRKELLPKEDKIYEERRLFYVALTRTKNRVYILSDKKNKSIFVKELEHYKNILVFK